MKTFQALIRSIFDFIRKYVFGFGSRSKNIASNLMMSKNIIGDLDLDDEDDGPDEELEGWVRLDQ